jgi:hypothetical protein
LKVLSGYGVSCDPHRRGLRITRPKLERKNRRSRKLPSLKIKPTAHSHHLHVL